MAVSKKNSKSYSFPNCVYTLSNLPASGHSWRADRKRVFTPETVPLLEEIGVSPLINQFSKDEELPWG